MLGMLDRKEVFYTLFFRRKHTGNGTKIVTTHSRNSRVADVEIWNCYYAKSRPRIFRMSSTCCTYFQFPRISKDASKILQNISRKQLHSAIVKIHQMSQRKKSLPRKKRRLYPSEHIESANVHDEAHVYSVKLTSIDTTHSFLKYTRVSPCVLSKAYNHWCY